MHLAINGWFWDWPSTGSGQYTRHLVEGLESRFPELDVSVVVPAAAREQLEDGAGTHTSLDLCLMATPRSNAGKVFFEQVAFPRACARLRADVAHVPYWAPPLRSPIPLVVTIHDLIPLVLPGYRGGMSQRLYTALVSVTARRANSVLTDSEAARSDIMGRLGLPDQRVRAVPLAASEQYHPEPSNRDRATRADYGLPDRYVLYLGGFDVRKNLVTALAAYRLMVSAVGGDCPLVIAGRFPERDTAFTPHPRRLALEQEVDERLVHFSGFVEDRDKPALYRGAVAFIFPSLYEGFGLPPLEALACGTPVVGSDAASLPEVVGQGGVLLPPSDAPGMSKALIRLVSDDHYRTEMSRRAVAQAARFSWDRTARATFRAYSDSIR